MTIKSSGSLTFTEIEAEWDNASPFSLSEFYSGTSTVFSGATDGDGNAIPSSGAISFSDFYNTTFFDAASNSTVVASGPGTATNNRKGQQTSSTATVPAGANAIFITNTVAGGGGGIRGSDHKNVGEAAGDSGGSGASILSAYFTVAAGETITFNVGHGGNDNHVFWATETYSQSSNPSDINGGTTSASGSSTGTLFTLTGGSGAVATDVGAFKSLRQDNPGSAGTALLNSTPLSSGTTTGGVSVGNFNAPNGNAGGNSGQGGGDNAQFNGADGADSAISSSSGGAGGTNNVKGASGSTGGGGGGGHSQSTINGGGGDSHDDDHLAQGASTFGGLGGHGQLNYQFVRVV